MACSSDAEGWNIWAMFERCRTPRRTPRRHRCRRYRCEGGRTQAAVGRPGASFRVPQPKSIAAPASRVSWEHVNHHGAGADRSQNQHRHPRALGLGWLHAIPALGCRVARRDVNLRHPARRSKGLEDERRRSGILRQRTPARYFLSPGLYRPSRSQLLVPSACIASCIASLSLFAACFFVPRSALRPRSLAALLFHTWSHSAPLHQTVAPPSFIS